MNLFNRTKLKILPLSQRESKTSLEEIVLQPDQSPPNTRQAALIKKTAFAIQKAREMNRAVIFAFGAHLIKNGLGLILRKMIDEGFITHLATSGAGSIHDWEFAFQGKSEEDVRKYIQEGQFGIWEETGKYLNLAIIAGAVKMKGYGESIGELISTEQLSIPETFLGERIDISPREQKIQHRWKQYSVQEKAYAKKIPFTVHPSFGQDIIYTHPLNRGAAIGITAEIDFLRFVESVFHLEGGVYISVGSQVMSPMIFEKALSMARNIARQQAKSIADFLIVVNDIQKGEWDFGSSREPAKYNPAYYLRFCKTFDRMGSKEMLYIREDNRVFLSNLYHFLKS